MNVELSAPSQNVSLQLMNALGQIIYENQLNGNQLATTIDVSHLPAGLYWIMMKTERNVSKQKLVIQR